MADAITKYLAHLVDDVEGDKYTNDPADAGGPTRWGITQTALARYRGHAVTPDDVRQLSRDEALAIYSQNYVDQPGYNRIAALSEAVAIELIDTGINCGRTTATRYLQRCLNVLNRSGNDWGDITTDGQCGPATAGALAALLNQRGDEGAKVLLVALNCLQGNHYIALAEAKPTNERFVYGWLRARVQLESRK